MKNLITSKIKALRSLKIITPVPVELKEQFDNIQLENSIRRIIILTIIVFIFIQVNIELTAEGGIYPAFEQPQTERPSHLFFFCKLAILILFNIAVLFFRKSNKKRLLWAACYLAVISLSIIYVFILYYEESIIFTSFIFFASIFLFTVLPDFKPKIFISFATLYFIATTYMLHLKIPNVYEFAEISSFFFNCFLFLLVTKILLYNSKVRTYVNTYNINKLNENLVSANEEIEKQKNELKNYNDNLEKMVLEKTEKIVDLKNAVMETMAELVEYRDDITGGHISRTSRCLKMFTDSIMERGLYREQTSSWNIGQMILSAQLHDVGKIAIDDSILRKPGKLTEEEFEAMKKHTVLGGEIIKDIQKKTGEQEFLDYAFIFAVYHHEKWDGTGYPYGKDGENIPLIARLMAIIDVYDALISERPYKKAFPHEEAIRIIKEGKGTQFDPALTELFLSVSDQLYE